MTPPPFGEGMPTEFEQLIKWFGLPGAMFLVMIYLLGRGTLMWSWQHTTMMEDKDKLILSKEEEIENDKKDFEIRYSLLRDEKNYWRDVALSGFKELEKATRTVEKAVDKLPKVLPPGE